MEKEINVSAIKGDKVVKTKLKPELPKFKKSEVTKIIESPNGKGGVTLKQQKT